MMTKMVHPALPQPPSSSSRKMSPMIRKSSMNQSTQRKIIIMVQNMFSSG